MLKNSVELKSFEQELAETSLNAFESKLDQLINIKGFDEDDLADTDVPFKYTAYLRHIANSCSFII
jgi:predicted membrane chloride channel (bestrophin family)